MAKNMELEPVETPVEPIKVEQVQKQVFTKKVDIKAWRERKLMAINKLPAAKAKKAAERIFRNKEA